MFDKISGHTQYFCCVRDLTLIRDEIFQLILCELSFQLLNIRKIRI